MSGAERLRELLDRSELVTVPGCSDALGAVLIEQAGFEAAYMTGFGSSATLLGKPDVGLLTGSEMVDNGRRIAAATTLPVIADADTGYGNPVNVMRTVREFERAGVAAIQIEDQVAPKRCGHMSDKQVIPTNEMVAKMRAAVEAREKMLLIARTDARAPEGFSAAIDRAHAYVEAGADALFVEALESVEEFRDGRRRALRRSIGVQLGRGWPLTGPECSRSRRSRLSRAAASDLHPAVGHRRDAGHTGSDPSDGNAAARYRDRPISRFHHHDRAAPGVGRPAALRRLTDQ